MRGTDYVLVTAAYNEADHIEKTIRSVIAQTLRPRKWVIVSDGSTDNTDQIVQTYGRDYSFIELLRRESTETGFASQAQALMMGCEHLRTIPYDFIGTLDADVTFEPDYYATILAEFHKSPQLGIVGGGIYEYRGDALVLSRCAADSVPGAIQLFRKKTLDDARGFLPLSRGGHDAVAEAGARMHGWQVRSLPHVRVIHHRACGASYGNALRIAFNLGIREYAYGNYLLFELAKCLRRATMKPYLLGGIIRWLGYCWAFLRREPRPVPTELIRYLRREQMGKLWHVVSRNGNRTKLHPQSENMPGAQRSLSR